MARTVSVPAEFFSGLQEALCRIGEGGALTPDAFRDAGFTTGEALFDHFADWLSQRGESGPATLTDERFQQVVGEFFESLGWGRVTVSTVSEAVLALDATEWSESAHQGGGCLISTGLFAGFFGRLAEAPISVLEVAPPHDAPGQCRFLLGSVDVLDYVWEAMERGISWENAAQSA